VHVDITVFGQEELNAFGLMGGEIVGDDMNLLTLRLRTDKIGEEGHELGAGVSIGRFTYDGSAGGIQSRIQRERSVAVVLESVPFGSTGRKRQNRVESVERLNGGLFVHTEDHSMGRGLEIKAENLGRFALKIRIRTQFVAAQPVRLQPGFSPHARDSHVRATQFLGQSARTPVSRSICRFAMQRPVNDTCFKFFTARFGLATFVSAIKTSKSFVSETAFPQPHCVDTASDFSGYRAQAATGGSLKDDPSPLRVFGTNCSTADHAVEFSTFWRADNQSIFHTRHNRASVSEINVTMH